MSAVQLREGALEKLLPRLREASVHTIVYGLGAVLQASLGFLLLPIYTRELGASTFGVFALLSLVGQLLGVALSLGAPSAVARSYFDYPEGPERRAVVGTAISIVIAGFFMLAIVGVPLVPWLSRQVFGTNEYVPHLYLVLAAALFGQLNTIFLVVLRFLRRSVVVVRASVGVLLVSLFLAWYAVVFLDGGLWGALLAMLVSQICQFMLMLFLCSEHIAWRRLRLEYERQLRYGIPAVAAGLLFYLLDSVDRVFLGRIVSLDVVGVYSAGYKLGMVIQILLIQPFGQIWLPMRLEYRREPGAPHLFSRVFTYYTALGMLLLIPIALVAPEVLRALTGGGEYDQAGSVVGLVLLGHLAYGSVGLVDGGLIFERRLNYHVWTLAGALSVNIALNMLLIPTIGMLGAAVSTLVAYVGVTLAIGLISQGFYRVPWDYVRLVTAWAIGLVTVGLGVILGSGAILLRLMVILVAWIAIAKAVLGPEERLLLRRLLVGRNGGALNAS